MTTASTDPLHLDAHPLYLEAVEFKKSIEPEDGVDYAWVNAYAAKMFDAWRAVYDRLDDKADGIIKSLGGGTGLLTVAALLAVTAQNAYLLAWLLPSFACSLGAVFSAAMVRAPGAVDFPPSVEGAFRYANTYRDDGESTFLGQWHVVLTSYELAIRRKAVLVRQAGRLFFASVAFLGLPLLAVLLKLNPL